MGNSNEAKTNIDIYQHPRLGVIKKIQQHNGNQYILYEMILQNKKIYDDWIKQLQVVKNDEDAKQILFLPVHEEFMQTAYCGTGGNLKIKYQDYFYSILPEIENRKGIKRPFSEQELLYLFYSLIKISTVLQAKNRRIGDVKPENILVNEDGYIKVVSSLSWPSEPMRIGHNWQKAQERLFLSPEQCEERTKKKDMNSDSNQSRYSEIYSIGLTILQAGTLKSCSQIYGAHNTYKFNEIKLIQYIDIFEARYSKQFSQMVKEMLHLIPRKRWRPAYIYEMLKPYEYQIMNLQQIPIKLDRNSSLARIDRQQKISIKKIGESFHNLSQYSQRSKVNHNNRKDQDMTEKSRQRERQRQRQSLMHSNQSYWSQAHQNNPMFLNNNSRYNNQPQQYSKFHLINENTNFNKQKPTHSHPQSQYQPQQNHHHNPVQRMSSLKNNQLDENRMMAVSMPIDLSAYESQHKSRQHYVTQNSMMAGYNRAINESRYGHGDIYYNNQ